VVAPAANTVLQVPALSLVQRPEAREVAAAQRVEGTSAMAAVAAPAAMAFCFLAPVQPHLQAPLPVELVGLVARLSKRWQAAAVVVVVVV
jgi:hypothetical protein